MSDKISIYEIQCALEEIIDAPDNKAVLNGIWRLRNRIAGDHNQDQLFQYAKTYKELEGLYEDEKRRHRSRVEELRERYRREEGSTKALKEAAEEFTDYVQTQLKGFYAEDIIGKFEDIRSKVIGEINQIK